MYQGQLGTTAKQDCVLMRYVVCLALLFAGEATAQGLIEGKVTDAETKEELIGAYVTYNEGQGTITDLDGKIQPDTAQREMAPGGEVTPTTSTTL